MNSKDSTQPPTSEEITRFIKQVRRKTPGPDDIPTVILKEPSDSNLEMVLELFVKWNNEDHIPEEELKARVALINKRRRKQIKTLQTYLTTEHTIRNLRINITK